MYQRSIDLGHEDAEVYLDRAQALADLGEVEEASRSAFSALDFDGLSPRFIIRGLKFIEQEEFHRVADSNAVSSLNIEQRVRLISQIFFERNELRDLALQLLRPTMNITPSDISDKSLFNELGVIYMSLREFKRAKDWFSFEIKNGRYDIPTTFNFAMADWGETGACSKSAFKDVIDLHESESRDAHGTNLANYLQCIALTYWATGATAKSLELVDRAKEVIKKFERTFSCWRYRYVDDQDFLIDIQEMKNFARGDSEVGPSVFIGLDENALDR